jgi:transcriptional regulator with XRE-family HTH domain
MAQRTTAPPNRRVNGATVAALRGTLGIAQASLAARCEISAPYLSQIESGMYQPGADVVRRLATELGVELDAITYPWHEPVTVTPEPIAQAS